MKDFVPIKKRIAIRVWVAIIRSVHPLLNIGKSIAIAILRLCWLHRSGDDRCWRGNHWCGGWKGCGWRWRGDDLRRRLCEYDVCHSTNSEKCNKNERNPQCDWNATLWRKRRE